jgi:SAM-dependent MidA family methyltransferase
LAHIGEQDLTCHVCWDWLASVLENHGFQAAPIISQEAFFVKNTAQTLARIMQEEASSISARKSGLLQLLHPSSLGQKFQVLSATRHDY